MTLYMVQFAYTPQAWTAFTKQPEDRTAAVEALAQKCGCRFEALYYSLGEYDGFVIVEAPDEGTVTAFVLAALGPGHLRTTKTTVLMRSSAVVDAMKKQGNESRLTPQRPQYLQQVFGIPCGAFAAALDGSFVGDLAHQVEGEVADHGHVVGPVTDAQA